MHQRRHASRGVTLVEMIIVLGIMAVLAAISIPAFVRMVGLTQDRIDDSARSVYNILRAARVYAVTYRSETAVIYALNRVADPVNGGEVMLIDGIGMARRMSEDDMRKAGFTESRIQLVKSHDELWPYVVVQSVAGQIQKLENETCVQVPNDPAAFSTYMGNTRLARDIAVYLPNETDPIVPRQLGIAQDAYFPAHIFTQTGQLKGTGADRVEIAVGAAPDAPERSRYRELEDGTVEPLPPVLIEIFAQTGRVRIKE
jgi:prepilin-type N-terminal cleavage/methylation domain-containing protein